METSAIIKPLSGMELTYLTYGIMVAAVVFGISSLYLAIKLRRLDGLYKIMMQGAVGESIEEMMLARVQDIENLKQKATYLTKECERLEEESKNTFNR